MANDSEDYIKGADGTAIDKVKGVVTAVHQGAAANKSTVDIHLEHPMVEGRTFFISLNANNVQPASNLPVFTTK